MEEDPIDDLPGTVSVYDGVWFGSTSADGGFAMTIESGGVTAVSTSFGLECHGDSWVAAQSYGEPYGWVEGDTVYASVTRAEVEGRFGSNTTAAGTIVLTLPSDCGGARTLTWEVERLEEGQQLLHPMWWESQPPVDALPDLTIPASLYDASAGAAHIDELGAVFADNGDWFLLGSRMNVFIAVPAGWKSKETGGETYLMFGEDPEGPSILVRMSSDGREGDARTSADVLAEIREALSGIDATVLRSEVVDDARAWLVLSMVTDTGLTRTMLMVASKNPEEGWFHTFSAFAFEDVFPDYYPILRAMVESWHGLSGNPLASPLPEIPEGWWAS